jgi:hypothetical protein
MHMGKEATLATTSRLPSALSAITWLAPQSENQRRSSCQRGDSPKTMPPNRTSGALVWHFLLDLHAALGRTTCTASRVLIRASPP